MVKLLLLLAAAYVAQAQFGGQQSCDYNRLMQAAQQKDQCMKDFYQMTEQAMREIQRYDSQCNQGIMQAVDKCRQPIENFNRQNDIDTQGIMECCFPGKIQGSGRQRICEFRNKEMMGHKKSGGGPGGSRVKRGGHGGEWGQEMKDNEEMMRKMMSSMTLAGLMTKMAGEHVEMVEGLMWCTDERRIINDQTMDAYRRWKDQMVAKLFECENMVMPVATNCTDVQPQDLQCIMKGKSWVEVYMTACFDACMPESLDSICRMATNVGGGQGPTQNMFNNPGGNDPFGNMNNMFGGNNNMNSNGQYSPYNNREPFDG